MASGAMNVTMPHCRAVWKDPAPGSASLPKARIFDIFWCGALWVVFAAAGGGIKRSGAIEWLVKQRCISNPWKKDETGCLRLFVVGTWSMIESTTSTNFFWCQLWPRNHIDSYRSLQTFFSHFQSSNPNWPCCFDGVIDIHIAIVHLGCIAWGRPGDKGASPPQENSGI